MVARSWYLDRRRRKQRLRGKLLVANADNNCSTGLTSDWLTAKTAQKEAAKTCRNPQTEGGDERERERRRGRKGPEEQNGKKERGFLLRDGTREFLYPPGSPGKEGGFDTMLGGGSFHLV